MFTSVSTAALGFPRMGPKRELKFALENDQTELIKIAHNVEESSFMEASEGCWN